MIDEQRAVIEEQKRVIEVQQARIASLEQEVAGLREEVQKLRAQLRRDSSNSSRPPSSDPPWKPPAQRRKKGRKRGGQPGHSRYQRELVPPDEVVEVKPSSCRCCGGELSGEDLEPRRHQVVEVPPTTAKVTEYRIHRLTCSGCGVATRAQLPEGIPRGGFGPRLQAIVATCSGAYRLSKRAIVQLCQDFFGVRISLGSVSNLEAATSAALAAPFGEAVRHVKSSQVVHADETTWYQRAKLAWLWVAATTKSAVFLIRKHRSANAAQELLGKGYAGVLVADQYPGYKWFSLARRQLCWAHLIRHFRHLLDFTQGKAFGERLLACTEKVFEQWHRIRDGTMKRAALPEAMAPIQAEFARLLREGEAHPYARVRSICKGLVRHERALWTFIHRKGVEPTNNAAERALRHAVLWRKTSFGTDSPRGDRFVERMLTVVMTLRLGKRDVLGYLTDACQATLQGRPTPALLG